MTRADKFEQVFGYRPATDGIICNENDWCGENDACKYCICNSENIGKPEDWWNAEYKEPTTKNDLAQERYQDLIEYFGDEKVIKTILEDKKEFKAWLERLRWNVKRADELARELEQIKGTTKNDLGVDCIDRQATLDAIIKRLGIRNESYLLQAERVLYQQIKDMPSVTPQEPIAIVKIKYDEDKLKELVDKAVLTTVMSQEREVLDKIRAEIKDYFSITCDGNCGNCNRVVKNPCGESVDGAWVLHIIDKYKAESEDKE